MFTPPEIHVGEARDFLTEHLRRDVENVEELGEGAWSRCFGFEHDGRELVIRFGNFVEDFEKDRRAASFGSPSLPIPEVTEIGSAFGGYFAISSRAYGELLESITAAQWQAVLLALFASLDALRSVDVSDTVGYGPWDAQGVAGHASWRDYLLAVDSDTPDRRTYGWRQRLIDSPIGDKAFRAGMTRLYELAESCPDERYVVHGDLLNRNVLVASGRITAVLDWGCSVYGDFLYDIAWLEFWAPWHPSIETTHIRSEARQHYRSIGLDVEDLDARLRCYMLHIGLDHQAYHAATGDLDELTTITERTVNLIE